MCSLACGQSVYHDIMIWIFAIVIIVAAVIVVSVFVDYDVVCCECNASYHLATAAGCTCNFYCTTIAQRLWLSSSLLASLINLANG